MSSLPSTQQTTQSKSAMAGGYLFAILFVLISVFLLSQLSDQTKFSANKQLFAQPRFWPGVAVIGMLLFGIGHVFTARAQRSGQALQELWCWIRSLEYYAWFMLYVLAVPFVGYLLATIVFMCALTLRQGYKERRYLFFSLCVATSIVIVFKTLLAVKIPGGAIYEYLPTAVRSFMIINF